MPAVEQNMTTLIAIITETVTINDIFPLDNLW